jgi:threonine/homoserine/homoserine lactone efflux protein
VLHGRRAALGTSLGVNSGLAVWTLASALGAASLVHASEAAFTVVKLKIGAFFTSVLPQFVGGDRSVLVPSLVHGGIFILMGVVWLSAYALVAVKASSVLARRRVKAAIDRLTGMILIGFGIRLALERR